MIITGIGLLLFAFFLKCWVSVPAATYGVRNIFGKRLGEWYRKGGLALDEGLHFVLPWEKIYLYPYSAVTFPIPPIAVTTKDGMEITLSINVDFAPDRRYVVRVYSQKSESAITEGLRGALETVIVGIAGKMNGLDFVNQIGSLVRLINCTLRLPTAPHLETSLVTGCVGNSLVTEEEIAPFYSKHGVAIDALLRGEKKKVNDLAPVEEEYGIDILNVTAHAPKFTSKMATALEEKRKNEESNKGVQENFEKKLNMMKRLGEAGVSADKALDDANISLKQAEQKVSTLQVQGLNLSGIVQMIEKGGGHA